MAMMEQRWLDPPLDDEWTARQVIRYHRDGDLPCANCSNELVCKRLSRARQIVAEADAKAKAKPAGQATQSDQAT